MRGVHNYMRRIGFCRIFPLVFTLIHVSLVWFSLAHQAHTRTMGFDNSGYGSVEHQEGSNATVQLFEPPPLKPVQKIALILELPAMFVATLFAAVLFPLNETAWLYTSIPFVPIVWYAIGRWLDGLLGYRARFRVPKILRGLLAVPAGVVLCLSLVGFTPLYHHRTVDTYWMFGGLVFWSGLCITMMTNSDPANR
jgi:hypothetical protein